ILDSAPKLGFNACESFGGRERRHLILQCRQLFHVSERQEVCARAERLADLDEGWPQFDETALEPRRLLFEPRRFALRLVRAAEDNEAHRAERAINCAHYKRTPP